MSEIQGHTEIEIGSERSFGYVFAAVFGVIGLIPLWQGGTARLWALAIAAVFALLGFFAPRFLRPLNVLWFRFGLLLGRIMVPIVMSLLFFVAVTPTALIMKLLRKDLLNQRLDPEADSYWVERSSAQDSERSMRDQF